MRVQSRSHKRNTDREAAYLYNRGGVLSLLLSIAIKTQRVGTYYKGRLRVLRAPSRAAVTAAPHHSCRVAKPEGKHYTRETLEP